MAAKGSHLTTPGCVSAAGARPRFWAPLRVGLVLAAFCLLAVACGDDGESLSANAGDDFEVSVGSAPEFDGCGSSGNIFNYEWVIADAPETTADAVGKELRSEMFDCSFSLENAMIIDDVGDWTIELTVTDSEDETATDQVQVTVVE